MIPLNKKNKFNLFMKNHSFLMVFIFIATILLGIGYAQISDIDLSIEGDATVSPSRTVIITDISYVSSTDANPGDSTIRDSYLTFMNSQIVLGNSLSSTITYQVTIKNNGNVPAIYDDVIYSTDLGYDNSDIVFTLAGIASGDTLNPTETKTFTITFQYASSLTTITNNTLNSYIHFKFDENAVAKIGDVYYASLQAALDEVPTTGVETTVELLKDTSEVITLDQGCNVVLDLGGNTLSNDGNNPVIANDGTLRIINGMIQTDASTNGAVNNTRTIVIDSGTHIVVTGGRQALYNNVGVATIQGDAYLSSVTTERATVQSLSGGSLTITGGTIISTGSYGLNNAGTLTIGVKDGNMSTTSPVIQGVSNGITSSKNYSFYDGVVKSKVNPFNALNRIANLETGYGIVFSTETIGGNTYNTAYLGNSKKVTFNTNGGTLSDNVRYVEVGQPIGTLPTPTRSGHDFVGWFTASNGGTQINASTVITNAITYYAHWTETVDAAQIGTELYANLQSAIDAVPTDNTQTTIVLLKDVSEVLTVSSGQNIVFDFNGRTLTNSGSKPIIENSGTVSISNGTFNSTADQAIINNSAGSLSISGGRFVATGSRQAIYITGGTVEISGDSYFSSQTSGKPSSSTMGRGTVQNISGTLIITGGTIIGTKQQGVSNQGTLTIGVKDGNVDSSTPVIRGATYGVVSENTFNFYDGVIKGITNAISGTVTDYETTLVDGTEVIDGKTYKTKYNH